MAHMLRSWQKKWNVYRKHDKKQLKHQNINTIIIQYIVRYKKHFKKARGMNKGIQWSDTEKKSQTSLIYQMSPPTVIWHHTMWSRSLFGYLQVFRRLNTGAERPILGYRKLREACQLFFLTHNQWSGSGIRCFYTPRIRDPDPWWSNGRIRIRDKTSRIRNNAHNGWRLPSQVKNSKWWGFSVGLKKGQAKYCRWWADLLHTRCYLEERVPLDAYRCAPMASPMKSSYWRVAWPCMALSRVRKESAK
jgi:hypothetical protein